MARYQRESEVMTMLAFLPYRIAWKVTVTAVKYSVIFVGMLCWYMLVFSFVAVLLVLQFTLKCTQKESATLSQFICTIVDRTVGRSVRTVDSNRTDGRSVGPVEGEY